MGRYSGSAAQGNEFRGTLIKARRRSDTTQQSATRRTHNFNTHAMPASIPAALLFKKGSEAAAAIYDHALSVAKADSICLVNNTNKTVRVESNFKHQILNPGEVVWIDWAFAVMKGTPDVTVWWNREKNKKKLIQAGGGSVWDGESNWTLNPPRYRQGL